MMFIKDPLVERDPKEFEVQLVLQADKVFAEKLVHKVSPVPLDQPDQLETREPQVICFRIHCV